MPALWTSLMLVLALSLSACAERETADLDEGTAQQDTVGQDVGLFGQWDTDANDELTYDEWNSGYQQDNSQANYYDEWDADNDRTLTREEFDQGLRDRADADDDGTIAEDEFNEVEHWFENVTFTDWDADGDNEVNEEEWSATLDDLKFWEDWNLDTSDDLTREEFNEGVFERWDENGDGVLTRNEFEQGQERMQMNSGMARGDVTGGERDGAATTY